MFRLMIALLLNMWLNVWTCNAVAQQLDVYRMETVVANQSEAERVKAAKATFGDVILRVTGDAIALQHPLIRQAINEAPNYLLRFNYASARDTAVSNRDTTVSNNTKTNEAGNDNGIKLILHFSSQAIENLLGEAQLSHKKMQQKVLIQITNVQDFTAFKQAQTYLKTVAMIRNSELLNTNKDILIFSVVIEGDVNLLKNTLEQNPKWQAMESEIPDAQLQPTQSPKLNFRWQYSS